MNSYFLIISLILIIICLSIDLGLNVDYGKYIAIGISVICLGGSIYSLRKRDKIVPDKMVVPGSNDKYVNVSVKDLAKANLAEVNREIEEFSGDTNSEEYRQLLKKKNTYTNLAKPSIWQKIKNKFQDPPHLYGQFMDEGQLYGNF